jgi:hypothetical protein
VSGPLQFGALAALRECLAAAEPVVLARYAAAVFSALEGALEAEATDPRLLPPLLAALIQVPLNCSPNITPYEVDCTWKCMLTARSPCTAHARGWQLLRPLCTCILLEQKHENQNFCLLGVSLQVSRQQHQARHVAERGNTSRCVHTQASRHEAALVARLPSVVDLLLGWALDPQLPPAARWVSSQGSKGSPDPCTLQAQTLAPCCSSWSCALRCIWHHLSCVLQTGHNGRWHECVGVTFAASTTSSILLLTL